MSGDAAARLPVIERVAILRRLDLFQGAPGHVLAAVAVEAEEVDREPGAVVIRQGDPGDSLFVLVEGRIRVDVDDHPVGELGPGSVLGELSVLVGERRSATVTALEDCRLLRLGKAAFDELLLDHPDVARGVITSLVRRFRERDRRAPLHPGDG